jgi:hypothetical protein
MRPPPELALEQGYFNFLEEPKPLPMTHLAKPLRKEWPQLEEDGTYSGFDEPAWMKRAKDPRNPSLGRSSVQTVSTNVPKLGEILFPTIRMQEDGTLKKYTDIREAEKVAINKEDYLRFDTSDEATAFSNHLSYRLGEIKDNYERSSRRDQ